MPTVVWNPLIRQEIEADTIFLFDAEEQKNIPPSSGGFFQKDIRGNSSIWGNAVSVVPGKYRAGVLRQQNTIWVPCEGLLPPDEWTIEFWAAASWGSLNAPLIDFIFGYQGSLQFFLQGDGVLRLGFSHGQGPQGDYSVEIGFAVNAPTGPYQSVAATLKNGTLRLFFGGNEVARAEGVASPRIVGCNAVNDGLRLGVADAAISDLRLSRYARALGAATILPTGNVLTITTQPTGDTISRTLPGGLHTLTTPKSEQIAAGALKTIRTDKLISATPIKAGGVPDSTHPTPGVSGQYCYDWQVVDRTLDYLARLGVTPYISLDYTPQVLGGSLAPYSGTQLTTDRTYNAPDAPDVPADVNAFATLVRDLVHHCIIEKGYAIPYWGVWNEPDFYAFWNGTVRQYLELYAACAHAVKQVSPDLKVGGPETNWPVLSFIEPLIEYCADNAVPLDFISAHFYYGSVADYAWMQRHVAAFALQHGWTAPLELLNGESCWSLPNLYGFGFSLGNYQINDWGAAWLATSLMEEQAGGFRTHIYTNLVAEDNTFGFASTGLLASNHAWANIHVYRAWSLLLSPVLQSSFSGKPCIHVLTTGDPATGNLSILLSRFRFLQAGDETVTIQLPAGYNRGPIYHYVIDRAHSDYYDAGAAHEGLELTDTPMIASDGTVTLSLKQRSVHMLTFGLAPASAPTDVTDRVNVTHGALRYDRGTNRWLEPITLTNTGTATLDAPLTLVLNGLPAGVTLMNKTGTTLVLSPSGSPYVDMATATLAPGASVAATLSFQKTGNPAILYTTRVVAGAGYR